MEINTYVKENKTVICLNGNLDGTTAEYTQENLITYVAPDCSIVIDMEKCPYVSSAGLRVLLMTAKQLAKIGGTGVFSGLTDEVKDVMEMTGFSSIFESYNSVDDAIAAFGKS